MSELSQRETKGEAAMRYGKFAVGFLAAISMLLFPVAPVTAGAFRGPVRLVDGPDDGDVTYFNIAVQQVTVTPIRAHVGDVVRIDVLIHDMGDGSDTIPAQVYANGKLIGSRLFTFGWSPGERDYHETFYWNTRGVKPGQYNIKGEAYLWQDDSPFDNSLTVKQPLILAAPGAAFPDGRTAGGSATERDDDAGPATIGGAHAPKAASDRTY
jgi:hypothetical protein